MNLREQILEIINSAPGYNAISSKVEPSVTGETISVEYTTTDYNPAFTTTYEVTQTVLVSVAVAQSDNYDAVLDTIVAYIKQVVLTNATFMAQFNRIPKVSVKYGYREAGDKNLAAAGIEFTFEFNETYPAEITADLSILDIKFDYIAPISDKNLFADESKWLHEPDGRIEQEIIQTF